MIITVASGKGGTGKTTVAVGLALALSEKRPTFLDCDVEEPNAALFLKPTIEDRREVGQLIPQVDFDLCTYCGRCTEVCAYHAIAVPGENVLVFSELCHGCGSCALNCPTGAISEVLHVMGVLERGQAGSIAFAHGVLNIGEAMAVPIIRQLKKWAIPPPLKTAGRRPALPDGMGGPGGEQVVVLDAPPGVSCPVVETMREADFVLLVTEPTPFGLHDLRVAVQVARDELGKPVGVVINRVGIGDDSVERYCAAEQIPVLMRIPLNRRIAEAYSEGLSLIEAMPEYALRLRKLFEQITVIVAVRTKTQPRKEAAR